MITSFFQKRATKRAASVGEDEAGGAKRPAMAADGAGGAAAATPTGEDPDTPGAGAAGSASASEGSEAAGRGPLPFGISVHPSWQRLVRREASKPYFRALMRYVEAERSSKTVFPAEADVFAALRHTALTDVRVVVLGQDPYHGPGQAHGLAFSVRPDVKIPPSLRNMYKEMHSDLGVPPASHGTLTAWARQGVLLLNTVLTVVSGKAHAHKKRGWETFTAAVLDEVAKQDHVAFLLWGKPAQAAGLRASSRPGHLRLLCAHPSPLSASRGYFGCKHFSKANEFLAAHGREPVQWELPADARADS